MSHNTKEGIAAQLHSYRTFYAIMRLRNRRGGYKGEEYSRLTPFTVLGRYYSDEFGQCRRLNRALFTDSDRAAMPPVMTDDEFQEFFSRHIRPRVTESFYSMEEGISGMAPAFPLPPPDLVCARCGRPWELEKCHDIDAEGDFEDLDLALFVGKTLREVESELAMRTDALRTFSDQLHVLRVKNPQLVDSSADEWAAPEQHGWRNVTWDYTVQAADHTTVVRYRFYHSECFRQLKGERQIEEEAANLDGIKQMLEETGFEEVHITRTSLPEHLRRWIATRLEKGENADQATEAFAYYRVETRQGSFGIVPAAYYSLLDLEGSGVSLRDIEPQFAPEIPSYSPSTTVFSGEPEQLLRLWQLLVKNQMKK